MNSTLPLRLGPMFQKCTQGLSKGEWRKSTKGDCHLSLNLIERRIMASVILTNSYFYRFDQKQWRTAQPYPPLATLFVASSMRQANRSFEFVDNCLQPDLEILNETHPSWRTRRW